MFRIDEDNCILWTDSVDPEPFSFATELGLMALADSRGLTREDLEGIWNGFAGTPKFSELKPVVKFRNRPYGVKQIWKAIQRLDPSYIDADFVEEKEPDWVKPKAKGKTSKGKTRIENAQKTRKTKGVKSSKAVNGFPREGSKAARAIQLMKRANGISGVDLQEAMGWLPHTTRGFISTIQSKHKIAVIATKHDSKGMVYRIE